MAAVVAVAAATEEIGVRHDGSLLVGTFPTNGSNVQVTETISSWRPGDAAWHQIGLPLSGKVQSYVATTDATGQETLWVTLGIGPFLPQSGGKLTRRRCAALALDTMRLLPC